jgi:hypothetical protein
MASINKRLVMFPRSACPLFSRRHSQSYQLSLSSASSPYCAGVYRLVDLDLVRSFSFIFQGGAFPPPVCLLRPHLKRSLRWQVACWQPSSDFSAVCSIFLSFLNSRGKALFLTVTAFWTFLAVFPHLHKASPFYANVGH